LRSPTSYSAASHDTVWSGKDKVGHSARIVKVTYDSQNGFGAMIRDCQYVAFWYEGLRIMYFPKSSTWTCGEEQSIAIEMLRDANDFKD
jgi:hypothetical protein